MGKPIAGDVVVLPFPQTNLQTGKRRPEPAVVALFGLVSFQASAILNHRLVYQALNTQSTMSRTSIHIVLVAVILLNMLGIGASFAHAVPPQYTVTILGTLGSSPNVPTAINSSGQISGYVTAADGSTHAVRWTNITPVDLGPGYGRGINAAGQVAGSNTSGISYAVRWNEAISTRLGGLGGKYTIGYGINASGQVCGEADLPDGSGRAVVWNGTVPAQLAILQASDFHVAVAINDTGEVAGNASRTIGQVSSPIAVKWVGANAIQLPTL